MCKKRGVPYQPVDEVSIETIYLVRLYMHAQNANIFSDFQPEELKYYTL